MGETRAVAVLRWGPRARDFVLWLALVLGTTAAAGAAEARGPGFPRVLLIDSYGADSRWSAELAAGVQDALATQFPQVGLAVEYMPSDPIPAAEATSRLETVIRQEHARSRFAAVIAADDAAFTFAMSAHDRLLPGVPLVFCGVSDLPPQVRLRHRLVTGTVLVHDVGTVMTSALDRHPQTRALVVVHDQSPAGLAYREQMQSWADENARRRPDMVVAFISAEKYSTPELIEQVRVLPLDCLVLLTSWSQDRDGQTEHLDDVLARIARVSPVPVYGITGAGSGFVHAAARLAEAHRQGSVAGTMVVKILQGVPPSEIPIRVLRAEPDLEARVPLDDAPAVPGVVRRSDAGSRTTRRWLLALGTLALLLQAVLIAMLFAAIRRHRAVRAEAAALRRRVEQIVECAGLGVFEWDVDTGTMTFNARYAESLGYLPEQIEPTRAAWQAMVHPDDLGPVLEALEAFLEDRAPSYAVVYRLRTKAGAYCRVRERGEVTSRHADGSPRRFLGVHLEADRSPDTRPDVAAGSASASAPR